VAPRLAEPARKASPFRVPQGYSSPAKTEEKRRKMLEVYEKFKMETEAYLKFGGEIGENFSQRIKKLFPASSKRGSRQQSRPKVRRVEA